MASTDTGFGEVRLFDDFITDTYDTFLWTVNSDTGSTAQISETHDGIFLFDGDGTDGDIGSIFGACIWQPSVSGTLVYEARLCLSTSTTNGVCVGFTDDNDTDEMPADLDGGTLTTTAEDFAGFVYDSQEGTNWYIVTSKNTADGAQTDTKVGPTADTFQTFRVVIESNGDCRFFIDGKEITESGAAREAAITTTDKLSPCVATLTSGTAADVKLDYIYVSAGRN